MKVLLISTLCITIQECRDRVKYFEEQDFRLQPLFSASDKEKLFNKKCLDNEKAKLKKYKKLLKIVESFDNKLFDK